MSFIVIELERVLHTQSVVPDFSDFKILYLFYGFSSSSSYFLLYVSLTDFISQLVG